VTTTGSRLLRSLGALIAVPTLVAGLSMTATGPAHAESRTTVDPAGDPVRLAYDGADEGGPESQPAPEAERVDLVSTRYEYRRQTLVVRGTARAAGRGVEFAARLRAAGQEYFLARAPGDRVQVFRVSSREPGRVRCPGARSSVDVARGVYGLKVPAACFGAPDRVRLGFGVSQVRSTRQSFSMTQDDANRVGGPDDGLGYRYRLGDGLARGAVARTTPDAVGDPVRTTYTFDEPGGPEPTGEPAPRARQVDLVSTRVDYRRQFLVVRGTAQAAGRAVDAVVRVRAAGREFYFFKTGGGRIEGFGVSREDEGPVDCRGGSSEVDQDRGVYQLRVPASCFGAPESVRVGFGLALDRSTRRTSSTTVDDAHRVGGTQDLFDLKLSPALARG